MMKSILGLAFASAIAMGSNAPAMAKGATSHGSDNQGHTIQTLGKAVLQSNGKDAGRSEGRGGHGRDRGHGQGQGHTSHGNGHGYGHGDHGNGHGYGHDDDDDGESP
jgi:hypothetical protein